MIVFRNNFVKPRTTSTYYNGNIPNSWKLYNGWFLLSPTRVRQKWKLRFFIIMLTAKQIKLIFKSHVHILYNFWKILNNIFIVLNCFIYCIVSFFIDSFIVWYHFLSSLEKTCITFHWWWYWGHGGDKTPATSPSCLVPMVYR